MFIAENLAERISTLFDSPQLIESMGKESERIIREEINLETVSDRYVAAFTKTASNSPL